MIGWVVAVVAVVVAVAIALAFAKYAKHPEQSASHDDGAEDSTSERFYGDTSRPAGPDVDDGPGM